MLYSLAGALEVNCSNLISPESVKIIGTLDCKSISDALIRLEMLGSTYFGDSSMQAVRKKIAAHLDIIVFLKRSLMADVVCGRFMAVQGSMDDGIRNEVIYQFEQFGEEEGGLIGRFNAGKPSNESD